MVDEAQCKQCNGSAVGRLRLGVVNLLSSGGGSQVDRTGSGADRARARLARAIVGGLSATNWLERAAAHTVERGIRIAVKRVALSAEQIAELTIPARRD